MLIESLLRNAQNEGDALAIIDDRGQHTWKELAQKTNALAHLIRASSQRPTIGILLPSGAAFACSFYAALLAGKSVVPINFLLGERETQHVVRDSEIDLILSAPPLAPKLEGLGPKVIDLTQLPPSSGPLPQMPVPQQNPDDLAVLIYTSGTSGLPKGVMLSYRNLQSNVDACIEYAGLQHRHVFFGLVPLFHAFGLTATLLAPTQLSATMVYQGRFSPAGALQAMKAHNVSLIFAVPSMYNAILRMKTATAEDFADLYMAVSGGEPLPSQVREAFEQRFGKKLLEGYGLTETSPVIALNTPAALKAGSVGRVVPGLEVRITTEEGRSAGKGEVGEIHVRGPSIMKGYFRLADVTREVMTDDGFFKTGDLGTIDDEGYLHITGRKKDMIIVSGEKAYPREIEEILNRHPAVADSAVVGKTDPSRGQVVAAFVQLREGESATEDELRDFARDQGLVNWKVPREVRIVADLPRSPTGKILKRVLQDQINQG